MAKHSSQGILCHSKELLFTSALLAQSTTNYNRITAPFNNMRTLKLKAQPTNAFFATVNQMFGDSSQLPTTVEHCVVV